MQDGTCTLITNKVHYTIIGGVPDINDLILLKHFLLRQGFIIYRKIIKCLIAHLSISLHHRPCSRLIQNWCRTEM